MYSVIGTCVCVIQKFCFKNCARSFVFVNISLILVNMTVYIPAHRSHVTVEPPYLHQGMVIGVSMCHWHRDMVIGVGMCHLAAVQAMEAFNFCIF